MKGFAGVIARLVTAVLAASFLLTASAANAGDVRYVSHRVPVQGAAAELAAMRPQAAGGTALAAPLGATANPWHLQATLPGAVIHDLAFPSAAVGYAAAELGQVWKTSDGGDTWTEIMNLGYPYYWYGVYAFSENDVVISGFDNQNFLGIARWSHDGGATWSDDVVVNDQGWSMRVRFADALSGIIVDLISLTGPNAAHYTTNGGATTADWTSVVPDPNGGWFGNQFSLLPGGHARMSGVTYCDSPDAGATWNCGPPADSVFDGPVFFADESNGWTGGGSISPDVAGWVHRTTDGGTSWSGRTLDTPFPIREILFLDAETGWAAGGNIYSNVGGIYFSSDGGQTWSQDFDSSGHELDACAHVGQRIWCAGYDASFSGAVYVLDFDNAPVVAVDPGSLAFNVTAGAGDSAPLTIANTGAGTLTFAIAEAPAAGAKHVALRAVAADSVDTDRAPPRPLALAAGRLESPRHPAPWSPLGDLAFVLDDGTYENTIGLNDQTSTEYAAAWLNRFSPPAGTGAFTIDSISILWPQNTSGTLVGKQVDLVAYYDADADGDPSNAVRLGDDDFVTIDSLDTFVDYAVNFEVPGDGDIYIGFVNSYALGGSSPILFPAAIDQDSGSQGASWIAGMSTGDPDIVNLGNDDLLGTIDSFGLAGNWLIRGTGTAGGGCSSPADVPWLSESPANGEVAPAGTAVVTVAVDASGLDPGEYSALLCIATNDPVNALVEVPVSLTVAVDDTIFRDGFDGTP